MRIVLVLSMLFLLNSCDSQDAEQVKNTESKVSDVNKWTPEIIPNVTDPYYVPIKATDSKFGPAVITRNVHQDRQGNIWLATWNGIIKYDGEAFINYTHKDMLPKYRAFCILENRNGEMWFGTIGGGVFRFDGHEWVIYTEENGLSDANVEVIEEDLEGNIWIGHDKGVSVYKKEGVERSEEKFQHFGRSEGMVDGDVHDITVDQSGNVWIASTGGINVYDGSKITEFTKQNGSSFSNVRTIIQDRNGTMWFGGGDGIVSFNGKSISVLNPNFTGYMYEASSGIIYCSTSSVGAVNQIALSKFTPPALPMQPSEIELELIFDGDPMTFGITEDVQGGIWFGSLNGVFRYDGEKVKDFKKQME